MKLDKTKYEEDEMDQQKEEEERLLIVMVSKTDPRDIWRSYRNTSL